MLRAPWNPPPTLVRRTPTPVRGRVVSFAGTPLHLVEEELSVSPRYHVFSSPADLGAGFLKSIQPSRHRLL